MTSQANNPQVEENYYQILEVQKTASLVEIRYAYEGKLEETQLEAFAAYSLLPEEETEEKLLHFSQAFMTLANPIARAKYDDELQQGMVSVEMQPVTKKEHLTKIKKSVRVKTKTVPLPLITQKKQKLRKRLKSKKVLSEILLKNHMQNAWAITKNCPQKMN